MKTIEEQLREYRLKHPGKELQEHKMERTIQKSKAAFYEREQEKSLSGYDFLFQQTAYIQKRWWIFQFLILAGLWGILYSSQSNIILQKSMGVLSSVFAIMIVPELWKNRSCGSMEIEGASYFSLRQIYAARLMLFGMVDTLLLSIFFLTVSFTLQVTIQDIIVCFLLPFFVTCGICFHTLNSLRFHSEFFAVAFCILWIAVWVKIILEEAVYQVISLPVWLGAILCAALYLGYNVHRVIYHYRDCWEVDLLWN